MNHVNTPSVHFCKARKKISDSPKKRVMDNNTPSNRSIEIQKISESPRPACRRPPRARLLLAQLVAAHLAPKISSLLTWRPTSPPRISRSSLPKISSSSPPRFLVTAGPRTTPRRPPATSPSAPRQHCLPSSPRRRQGAASPEPGEPGEKARRS